ncbi:hypothetical protein D3C71_23890 [compost metagenome]
MNLFGTLVIIVAIVWVLAYIERPRRQQEQSGATPGRNGVAQAAGQEPAQPPAMRRPRLAIEGTESMDCSRGVGFVKGFALPPAHVADLVKRVGPGTLASLPESMQQTLRGLYQDGCLHGLEVVDLLFRGASLEADKALYFAMVAPPNQPIHVVGFVDKNRS